MPRFVLILLLFEQGFEVNSHLVANDPSMQNLKSQLSRPLAGQFARSQLFGPSNIQTLANGRDTKKIAVQIADLICKSKTGKYLMAISVKEDEAGPQLSRPGHPASYDSRTRRLADFRLKLLAHLWSRGRLICLRLGCPSAYLQAPDGKHDQGGWPRNG